MNEDKDKSPAPEIDKAIKELMKEMKNPTVSPEELKAKAIVIKLAVDWQKVKHNIKDEGDFNPANL